LTLTKLEQSGLLSKAEELGLLSFTETLLTTDPGLITAASIPPLAAAAGTNERPDRQPPHPSAARLHTP